MGKRKSVWVMWETRCSHTVRKKNDELPDAHRTHTRIFFRTKYEMERNTYYVLNANLIGKFPQLICENFDFFWEIRGFSNGKQTDKWIFIQKMIANRCESIVTATMITTFCETSYYSLFLLQNYCFSWYKRQYLHKKIKLVSYFL